MYLLSVVVPCFNEEGGLRRLHDVLVAALAGRVPEYEVVLVDDGSTDRTLREARQLAALNPRFRYVSLSRNFGKESAMLCGLRHARGDRVAIMDADLQHPPDVLRRMLRVLDSGCDQVVARRDRSGEQWGRRAAARWYYRLAARTCAVPLPDGAGDFRVLSRRAVDAVLALPEYTRFSKGLFSWIGFDTAYVSFRDARRARGTSRWSVRSLVDHGISGLVAFNDRPLRSSLCLGVVTSLLAAGGCAAALAHAAVDGSRSAVHAALTAVVVVVGGVQLVFLGVLGEYLGRIYAETRRRPHYLVKEIGPDSAPDGCHRLRPAEPVAELAS